MVFAFNLKRTEKKYIIFKYFGGSIIMVLLDKGILSHEKNCYNIFIEHLGDYINVNMKQI